MLMFENRSFDNLLGRLYPPGTLPEGARFDGVANGSYSKPSPSGRIGAHVYEGSPDRIMRSPTPGPGEKYPHVSTQLFDTVVPPGDEGVGSKDMVAPGNAPPVWMRPAMDGFVADYINSFVASAQRQPSPEEYAVIMGSFSPEMLPVTSTLARAFAVYDAWFCGVPSQTFCNRSFFYSSASSGFVTNDGGPVGYRKWHRPQRCAARAHH